MKNLLILLALCAMLGSCGSPQNATPSESTSIMSSPNIEKTGSDVTAEEVNEFLEHHNSARKNVGNKPLIWNAQIAAVAQNYAELLVANGCQFEHSMNPAYGENIFMGNGMVFTALDGSNSWYDEINTYTYNNSSYNHYTQMIWKETTDVGVGVAICENGSYIIVANYSPKGNMLGAYPY